MVSHDLVRLAGRVRLRLRAMLSTMAALIAPCHYAHVHDCSKVKPIRAVTGC